MLQSFGELDDDVDDEFKDVADDLCLAIDPQVTELGDPVVLNLKKRGKLNVDDEEVMLLFKKHKSRLGKAMFEAENANNLGVELFAFGDIRSALAYFQRALECCSKKQKPAAQALSELKAFIRQSYEGDVHAFYTALSDGEWRLSLGRRRFVNVMNKLGFTGDPDRIFTMLDFFSKDGKATMSEIDTLLQTKGARLSRMDNDPTQKGVILCNIGACHIQMGEQIVGLQKIRQALKIVQTAAEDGDEDIVLSRVMSNVAVAYIHMGDVDAALNYLARVLSRHEATHGDNEPEVLQALYLSGYCFLVKGNRFNIVYDQKRMDGRAQENAIEVNYNLAQCAFKERLRKQEAALEALQDELEDDDTGDVVIDQLQLDIAQSHEIIAEICDKRGEFDRAIPHLWQAIFHKEAVLNEMDPEILSSRNVVASLLMRSGRFSEALGVMDKAVAATTALFGEPSLALATELLHVGLILFRMACQQQAAGEQAASAANFELSIEKVNEAKEMQAELLGQEDPEFAGTLQLLGNICLAAGHRRDARKHFEQALMIRVAQHGRADVGTASSAHALGTLYARTPRHQNDAVLLLRKACLVREARLGPDSLYLAESLHELGSILLRSRKRSDHELALQHLSRAAKIREQRLGKESLKYAASMHQVGQAHAHLALYNEAALYLRAALVLRERMAPKISAQIATTKYALGVILYKQNEFRASMKMLRAAYTLRESMHGAEHPQSADCLHQIGIVHFKAGEAEAALPFLMRALEIRQRLNDADAAARQEDSDEDPRDLSPQASPREKRSASARRHRRKAVEDMKKQKRAQSELSRGKSEQKTDMEVSASVGGGTDTSDARFSKSVTGLFRGLRSKSSFLSRSGSQAAGLDIGDEALAEDSIALVPKKANTWEMDSDDSDVCMRDIGIDSRGWLCGSIGSSMLSLGIVHLDLKNFRAARKFMRRAICIHEEVFGHVSVENAEALHAYGVLNKREEQLVPALRYFQSALQVCEKACGHLHESTAQSCIAVGEVLTLLGQPEDATIFLVRGIGTREKLFGPQDAVVRELKEKWSQLMASSMEYDPVKHGEALPHFARRSPESLLHAFAQRGAMPS